MIITDKGILLQDDEVPSGIAGITKTKKVSHACLDRALKLADNVAYDCTSEAAIKVRFGYKLREKECYPILGKSEAGGLLYHVDAVYSEDIDSNWDGLTDILISRPDTNLAKLTTVLLERAIQVSKSSIFSAEVGSNGMEQLSLLEIHNTKEPWLYNISWEYGGSFSINDTESLSNILWEYRYAIVGFDRKASFKRLRSMPISLGDSNYKTYDERTLLTIAADKELTYIEYKTIRMKINKFASSHMQKN